MSAENTIPTLSELSGIGIFLPSFNMAGGEDLGKETRCFPGVEYSLGYGTIPSDFILAEGSSTRSDLNISLDVISGGDLVESTRITNSSWGTLYPLVKFNADAEGSVTVQLSIEDVNSGEVVRSNELTLSVAAPHGNLADEDLWGMQRPVIDTTPIVLREGEVFDCTTRISLAKHTYQLHRQAHRGESRYSLALPSTYYVRQPDGSFSRNPVRSSDFFTTGTDRMSIIGNHAGEGKLGISWLVQVSTGEIKLADAASYGVDIPVTVIDNSEALADTMNLRFKIPEIVIDRSYRLFYSYLRNNDLLEGTKYTWPYESEDGERDKRLQLREKYGVTNYEDLLEYDDPNGYFDSSRLTLRFENSDGEYLINSTIKDSGVLCAWEEGTIYLVAYYGTLDSTRQRTRVSIPFRVVTSDPSYIPIREVDCGFATAHADELDFNSWYPASKAIEIVPADATTERSEFTIHQLNCTVLQFEKMGTTGTIDERYKMKFTGIGSVNYGNIVASYKNDEIYSGTGGIFTVGLPEWDGYTYRAAVAPSGTIISAAKSEIKQGEYLFISVTYEPDEEFVSADPWEFRKNSGDWVYSDEIVSSGFIEVICKSHRGIIIRAGSSAGVLGIKKGTKRVQNGSSTIKVDDAIEVTILSSTFTTSAGTPTINAVINNGIVQDNQTLTLSNGVAAGWNSSSWRYASIDQTGLLRTNVSGAVTIYAVTTDGRLASSVFTTQSSGTTPINPEPDVPVDTTIKEAQDTSDDIILLFDRQNAVDFSTPDDSPISVSIIKGSHNFDLSDVVCISENPGVATIEASYNMGSGSMGAAITPKGKGSTVVRIVCGGAEDSLEVNVLDGAVATTPNLEYYNQYGVSLNIYEYTDIRFIAGSNSIYQALEYNVSSGREDKIIVEALNYDTSSGIATIRITLKDHVSGYVYVTYGTERLVFSVANRFNLKFEDINNFSLGIGAERYIKIYPLDNTIKASSVQVYSQNLNVSVSDILEEGIEQETGKRYFLVKITYRRAGSDILIAHRAGDDDIYLDFVCEAKSIPAQSISFNTNSITINK